VSGTGVDHGLPRTALQVAMLMQQLGHSNNAVLVRAQYRPQRYQDHVQRRKRRCLDGED